MTKAKIKELVSRLVLGNFLDNDKMGGHSYVLQMAAPCEQIAGQWISESLSTWKMEATILHATVAEPFEGHWVCQPHFLITAY